MNIETIKRSLNKRNNPAWDREELAIYESITKARSEMEQANCLFNEMTEKEQIDYASYNLLAAKTKYSYLLKMAREKGMRL